MQIFKRTIDVLTLGSDRPMRRLLAYYIVLVGVTALLMRYFPIVDRVVFSGERLGELTQASDLLRDGLTTGAVPDTTGLAPRLDLVLSTTLSLLGTLLLMLPVSWVYMSVQRARGGHNQAIVQTLIILPVVVAGIILIVRNSLALAFSLAGVVAGVRFRTTLSDAREITFVFLAIAVGFAAGVQVMTVAALVSVIFNLVLLLTWRYDFGRNVLAPTAAAEWAEPLDELATTKTSAQVPDRDLLVALTPKKVAALEERFGRVRALVGPDGKKPRYNAILSVRAVDVTAAQRQVEPVLDQVVKRWSLDEVVSNDGKPSELYYLVRMRKSDTKDELLTAVRAAAGDAIEAVDLELGAVLVEADEAKAKAQAKAAKAG
jgi:hypothetical protein